MYKIQKKDLLDYIIISLMLLFVLVQTWAHVALNLSQNIILILIITRLISNINIRIGKNNFILFIFMLIVFGICGVNILTSSRTYLRENIKILLFPTVTILYYIYLVKYNSEFVEKLICKLIFPLNIYFFVNSIVMLIQTSGNYFLMDTHTTNTYYPDLITGFIGADGTHRVTMFTIFVVLLNHVGYKILEIKQSRVSKILFFLAIIISFFVSTKNDNITFFILVPVFLLMVYFMEHNIDFKFLFANTWKIVPIAILTILIIAILLRGDVFQYLMMKLQTLINTMNSDITMKEYQSDERILLFSYALENGSMWGKGLGSIQMFADESITTFFGAHFGMASAQSFVYFFGLIPYLLILLSVSLGFDVSNRIKNILIYFILLFGVSFYTQIFTTFGLTVLLCLCFMTMSVISRIKCMK